MKTFSLTCLGMAALAVFSYAKDDQELPDHSLSEWKLGDIISGDKVSLDKLDGKVVAIENWGIR